MESEVITDFLVSPALASESGGAPPGLDIFFLIALFVVFYLLIIRPQMKRQKQHRQMVSELESGDEIVTTGGTAGRITKVGDGGFLDVEISSGVVVKLQRSAVSQVLPKGTLKEL